MSALRARLDAMRGSAAAPNRGSLGDLRARIERLQARGARAPSPTVAHDEAGLARQLGGEVLAPGLILVERRLAPGTRHGRTHLTPGEVPGALGALHPSTPARAEDVVFMDTETTGLAGGTGTLIFLLGVARFEGATLVLRQYLLACFEGEQALLEAARTAVEGATHLVSYNGRAFDAPLVATRCRLSGVPDPFASLEHVDLLAPTRRGYRGRWQDCRLVTAERRLLGLTREHDLPGSEAPAAWFAWVRHGRGAVLGQVIAHNRLDVLSLAALGSLLAEALADPLAHDANIGRVLPCAAREGGEAALYGYLKARVEHLPDDGRVRLAHLARQRGEWTLAVQQWHRLAAVEHVEAFERLAKYHEHVSRDIEQAVAWTARLLAREPGSEAHRRRARRLEAKRAARARAS